MRPRPRSATSDDAELPANRVAEQVAQDAEEQVSEASQTLQEPSEELNEPESQEEPAAPARPLGSWREDELRMLPRFPHQESFPIARGLINRYLTQDRPDSIELQLRVPSYRDLRVALFWLGFGLLETPTLDEPTMHLVPLCKDLDTYADTATELGYDPASSVHSRPAWRKGIEKEIADTSSCLVHDLNGSSSSSSQGQSSSSSSTPLCMALVADAHAASSSCQTVAGYPLAGLGACSGIVGEPGAASASGAPVRSASGRTRSRHVAGANSHLDDTQSTLRGNSASLGLPSLYQIKAKRSLDRSAWRRGRASAWLTESSDEEDDEVEDLSHHRGLPSSYRRSLPSPQEDLEEGAEQAHRTSSQGARELWAWRHLALEGLPLNAEEDLCYKVKLLHAGGWSSSSGSSEGDRTPRSPRASSSGAGGVGPLAQQAGGLEADQLGQFTVSFVSGMALYEDLGETSCLCTFCLDEMRVGEELCRLPCMHTFHRRCVHQWLARDRRCMLCRLDVTRHDG